MPTFTYANGHAAVAIDEISKSGFIYYPNGKVAVAISTASSYQNAFYAYDNDKKNSLLLGLNENAIGFCSGSKRASADIPKVSVVFTKVGGVVTDEHGTITRDWVWIKKLSTDVTLQEMLTIPLSEHFTLSFKSREEICLEFTYENIRHTLDMGVKILRTKPNYLQNAKRLPGGHLLPQIDKMTLKQRTIEFNDSMKAQRNKLNPKSQNLSEMVRGVVAGLENSFDNIAQLMHTVPGLGTEWKGLSLSKTLSEIPHIPLSGMETGGSRGFSNSIYVDDTPGFDPSMTLPKNLMKNGTWKNSVEILAALEDANPPIKRTFVLKSASGRYSNMIIVNPLLVTPQNPTGMVRTKGRTLPSLTWKALKEIFATAPAAMIPSATLIVGLVMREGEPNCCMAKGIAEIVNLELHQQMNDSSKTGNAKVDMVKIDVSENSSILSELGIRSIPTFVMISSGRLLYAGPVGGRKVHLTGGSSKPQVLLIEPTFKDQISMEKTLKKNYCDSFLCMTMYQALERLHQISQIDSNGAPPLVFDIVLVSEDVDNGDFDTLYRKLAPLVKSKRTVIAGLVSVLGDDGKKILNSTTWVDYCSFEVDKVLHGPLKNIASVIVQKPIKASSIRKLINLRTVPPEDINFGLTPETLISKINEVNDSLTACNTRANRTPNIGIKLSAEDVKFAGISLVKPSNSSY